MKYDKKTQTITIDKELNDLDKFVLRFIKVLNKHTPYVIVSGYVSILLGRARATEDVDLLIPKISKAEFKAIYSDLIKNSFWCINGESPENLYNEILQKKSAVRFAKKDTVIPNMEFKIAQKEIDNEALDTAIKIVIGKDDFIISNLELQITYKKQVLGSPKDLEDARHLENLFENELDKAKIQAYEARLK